MIFLVLMFVIGLLALWFGGVLLGNELEGPVGSLISLVGIGFLISATFGIAPLIMSNSNGLPKTDIKAGEYYVSHINIEVEYIDILTFNSPERLLSPKDITYYRLPKKAFEGDINIGATKLVVIEFDGFKRLVLE